MSNLTIRTNNIARNILSAWELTDKERAELDYIDFAADEDGSFFRYKGNIYDLNEFQRVTDTMYNCHGFAAWSGFQSDSFFSGILVRYTNNFESVVVGQYFS
jgi:hypothetical protein